jgi:pyroglutamyl-peptidase
VRALVTGFDAFGGDETNASCEAVLRLPPRVDGIDVVTAILPTSYMRSLPALEAAIARAKPQLVLCVGQAGERTALNVERVAINVQDTSRPDNDGAQPADSPVVPGGPPAYFTTLPIKEAVVALHEAGLPAEVSNSAGTFVCNHVFYGLMRLAAAKRHRFRAGFLHVPRLSSLPCEDAVRGIEVVLRASAAAQLRVPV